MHRRGGGRESRVHKHIKWSHIPHLPSGSLALSVTQKAHRRTSSQAAKKEKKKAQIEGRIGIGAGVRARVGQMLEHNVKVDMSWVEVKKRGLKIVKCRWVAGWKALPDDLEGVRSRCRRSAHTVVGMSPRALHFSKGAGDKEKRS